MMPTRRSTGRFFYPTNNPPHRRLYLPDATLKATLTLVDVEQKRRGVTSLSEVNNINTFQL